ncbi:MAG TPA: hypothetical protein VE033_11475, partial [Acetobacteraceae bacterium]|nr:hypothetical protein [Acetobacteraceae bacterium]
GNPWWIRTVTFENYAAILGNEMFRGFFWNSLKVTVLVVALTMLIAIPAAFVYPTAFITRPDEMPLTIGVVSQLIRGDTFAWGQLMAGALLAALPPVIVYAFLMDYYIAGLTAGATKG